MEWFDDTTKAFREAIADQPYARAVSARDEMIALLSQVLEELKQIRAILEKALTR